MSSFLIAYASKRGSTAEIAAAIADEIRSRGHEVTCVSAKHAPPAEEFDAVVIGSAVYAGRWRKPAARYLRQNTGALEQMPFWIFSSGPVGEDSDAPNADRWLEPPKVMQRAEAAGVREHVVFGGRVPLEPGNFVERSMVKNTPPELADRRDWDEIRAWAGKVADAAGGG